MLISFICKKFTSNVKRLGTPMQLMLILAVALVAICHPTTNAAPNGPRIEIKPAVSPVFFESQAVSNKVLTCKALGVKPGSFSELRWTGPNRKDNWDELKKRHKVRESNRNGHSLELEFQRPTPDDSGTYYCTGIHQFDQYNATVDVRVFNPIKLENCPDRQFVVEGLEQQKITCRITGDSPNVVFSKDGNPIDQNERRYKWDNEDGLVILGMADKQDAGEYTIEVTNELTGDRRVQTINVQVHSKPEIMPYVMTNPNSPYEYTSVEGDQAELKCQVSGNPRPLVYWLDPHFRNLTSVGGYFVNFEKGTLLISRVNRNDDNGDFQCVAYNTVGEARRSVKMAVSQRPAIVAFENKTANEDTEITLECRATGFPKPTFSIRRYGINQAAYRVGDGVVTDLQEIEEGGGAPVYIYKVKIRASRSNFGLHYCNATNVAGHAERVGQLTVRHKPDLSQTPPEQRVKLGKNITLTCHIKAFPTPTVSWYADNQQILNIQDSNFKTSPDGQTHIVTMMPPIGSQNFPRFRCVATNELGQADQVITPRFTSVPSAVNAAVLEAGPTTVKLQLSVYNDGGDRIKAFRYKAEGVTMDQHNPFSQYPVDKQNETYLEASPSLSIYTIRNLFPFYKYRISIRAVNDVGDGDTSDIHVETQRPTRPEPPVIIKPIASSIGSTGFPSEYQDGYVLRWGPPDLDNGDRVTKYIIKFNRVNPDTPDLVLDTGEERIIEQMNERPMIARITPLAVNQHYKIQIQARNQYGDSDAANIVIYTPVDKPSLPNHDPQTLPWLTEPSTTLILILLVSAILFLTIIDIVFCLCFQIGVSYTLRNCCCPPKANSVMSDKTYTGD